MPRSGAEARSRLKQAALELYRENGYDKTTTAEIAARAGVTERTFFRHFPDKREVLFDGEADLRSDLTQSVASAPEGLAPLEILLRAFKKAGRIMERNLPFAEPRRDLIAATPTLRERNLAKAAMLAEALAEALRERGVEDRVARLAAQVGWATFHHATQAWIGEPGRGLDEYLDEAFADLRELGAGVR
ncbi:TetR/AcrR family transcriptional regulator [Amycolatopsis silviterrae]|uniref:TetR/AcrR family transcriptional regulator n=1 Tax=Amycolatopsis silviterrae TaxID=1656914 RepID=A0ABW5H4I5_9PSEU